MRVARPGPNNSLIVEDLFAGTHAIIPAEEVDDFLNKPKQTTKVIKMMTTTDLRLKYQKEFGGSLDSINHMAWNGDKDYVQWLEDTLLRMIRVNKHMLDMTVPHLYK